jgi:hypothetical protein
MTAVHVPSRSEVADIFRDHGAAWRKANRGHVSLCQLKVMSARSPRSWLRSERRDGTAPRVCGTRVMGRHPKPFTEGDIASRAVSVHSQPSR